MILQNSVQLYWKIRTLTFNQLGEVIVDLAQGFDDNQFIQVQTMVVTISPEVASAVLDVPGNGNLTRRQDIGSCVYQYLIDANIISGTIS